MKRKIMDTWEIRMVFLNEAYNKYHRVKSRTVVPASNQYTTPRIFLPGSSEIDLEELAKHNNIPHERTQKELDVLIRWGFLAKMEGGKYKILGAGIKVIESGKPLKSILSKEPGFWQFTARQILAPIIASVISAILVTLITLEITRPVSSTEKAIEKVQGGSVETSEPATTSPPTDPTK